jgi:protein tyrosine phosphatase (PTP) superfamily phosphohydrolase (DUF442 family)
LPAAPQAPPVDTTQAPSPPAAPLPQGPPRPSVTEERSPTASLPAGIPQFALVKDRVATGLRPLLDEGLDWLKANGYRTVLHLKKPGEDDSADRRQVEKRGLRYLSLEVLPATVSRQLVDEFNRVVADKAGQPLFVYDRDGSAAGALWYLHFRTAEQLPDDVARVRAGALGLRENGDDAHREMWLAIQRFLSEQPR